MTEKTYRNLTILGFCIILFVIGGICLAVVGSMFEYVRTVEPVPQQTETPLELPDVDWMVVGKVAGCLILVFLLYSFFQTDTGKIFGIILLIVGITFGVGYALIYGDKDGDGVADPSIIKMIQPVGDDAERDAAYAGINEINSGANMKSTASNFVYFFAFLLFMIVISGMYVLFGRKVV